VPFKSEKQRRYLWANKPEVARKYAKHSKRKSRKRRKRKRRTGKR
jgi:hypothetical protein